MATSSTSKTRSKSSSSTSKSSKAKAASACSTACFEYFAPEAKLVTLAGSFNDWDTTKIKLKKDKSGRWKVELDLQPGSYQYRYLVDGRWENDQRPVACVRNAYGSSNSVVDVPQSA